MKRILASIVVSVLPLSAFAANTIYNGTTGVGGLMAWFSGMLALAIPILIALAVVFFIYQVFRFAVAGGEEEKAKAKTQMIWGLVGIFVMVSVWGLIGMLTSTFNLDNTVNTGPGIPVINSTSL